MNYTGYSVLKVTKDDGAYAYGLKAYALATGATGAGGYLNSYATTSGWNEATIIHGIQSGVSPLAISGNPAGGALFYTGLASIIGGSTPNGDARGEATGFFQYGTTNPYIFEKNTNYSGALYAAYSSPSYPTYLHKIGIGTNYTAIDTSGYYEGNFTTRNIYEFETSFTPDLDDLTKTTTGSGVYKNGDSVSLQFNILNRNGELLTSAAQIAADPFIDKQVISILDVDSNVVFPNYRDNGDSTFTFSRSQNIDVFGTYTRNFGVRNEIVNKNGLTSTGEFYLYGNTTTFDNILVQASGETVLNENLSNHSPPDTGSITSAADRADAIKYFNNQPVNTSGSTGFIELSLAFNEDPTFTQYSNLDIWTSDTENFDSDIGNFVGSFPLDFSQEGQTIRLTPDNGIQDGTGLFFKLAAESSVGFKKEIFNLGPFTIEPIVEGPDLNLYNQGDQSMVGDFTIEGGLEGDSSNGGNLNVSGNALGTGIGGRLTGPESKMYLLSGDAGTESDTLQSVTLRGKTTNQGLSLIGSTPLYFDSTIGVADTNKSLYYYGGALNFGQGITTIKSDYENTQGNTLELFPTHSVTIGGGGTVIGSSPATGSAILGGQSGIISGHYSTIAGGFSNKISGSNFGFIGGGSGIEVVDSVYAASIGGYDNDITGSNYSVIGGGQSNYIEGGNKNFIGGGSLNTISGSQAVVSAILGGENNLITGLNSVLLGGNSNEILSSYSFIGGGEENITSGAFSAISAGEGNKTFGLHSIIAGGQENTASGTHSFIGGGHLNTASANYSYAFGRRSKVGIYDTGAAVFSDGRDEDSISSGAHTATLDFSGGVYVPTSGMFGEGLFVSGVPVLTGAAEADTLQTVTNRGNVTTTSIKAAHISGSNLTLGNGVTDASIQLDGDFGGGDLTLQNLGSNQDIFFKVNDGGVTTTPFTIHGSTSRVGVGTASPAAKLHVEDSSTSSIRAYNGSRYASIGANSNAAWVQAGGSPAHGLRLSAGANGAMSVYASRGVAIGEYPTTDPGADNFTVAGNVGIGTALASKELDVVGDIEVYNSHSAVNVGSSNNIATGNKSIAFGINNLADGANSVAIGQNNDSHGNRSIAIGVGNDANENDGVVVGQLNTVNADAVVVGRSNDVGAGADISIGENNWVSGTQAVGVGVSNTVSGNYAQIFGRYNQGQFASVIYGGQNTSQSYNGILFGQNNDSSGDSQAFGKYNYVTGTESTAIGRDNVIDENYSLAAGWENKVYGPRSAAVGYGNVISGNYSSAFGYYTVVGTNNTTEIGHYSSSREREGAVRIHDNHLVAISMRSGTAPTASTANDGFESETSLGSDMYTIQRNGSDYILYHNLGGSIETTTLGAAETQTLQDVCDNGNTTTTSIFSTGPYISGVTGLFNKEFHVGDLGSNSHAFNFEKGNGAYDTNIVLKPFGNPGGFNSSYWMTVSKQAYSGFITNGNNSDFYIGHDLNKTALKLKYDGGGVSTFSTSNADINFEDGTLFVDESAQRVGIGITSPSSKLDVYQTSSSASAITSRVPYKTNADSQLTQRAGLKIDINEGATSISIGGIGSSNGGFLQAYQTSSPSTDRPFVINPFGGKVGTNYGFNDGPDYDFDVNGTGRFVGDLYVQEVVSGSNSFLGTGVGNRITNNGVPYLLSGDSPAETQTLQDVCDNGNTTTTSIISTGPYISGVTGYYKDTLRVGDGGFVNFPSEYDTLQVGTSSSATNGHILVRGKESSITFRGVEGSDKAHTIKEDAGTLTFYGDSTLSGTAGNARFAIQTGQSYFTDLVGVRGNGVKPQFYLASVGGGASNKATHFYQPANSADFRIALNGSQNNGTIGTDAFAIKSTYEVGVGTVDPRAALHVDNGAGATTGFLVENSSNKNILWAEDNESINARSTFNIYHTTVSSRYLKLGWGSIFANDNDNELTLGSNYSSNSATRIFVTAEGADNTPANTIQMQANHGLAVFSGVSTDTFEPTALIDVRGDAYISGSVEGTGAGNRITNNGVPYLLSGDSPAETQTLQDVTDNGNTTTNDIITSGDVQADEFIGDLRGAVSFRAKAAEALSAGEVVFISGIDGNTTVVAKADANDPTRMPAFGVSKETVNANANVRIVNFGSVSNINTSSYSEGDELFVSNTAGLLTGIAPTGESSALQKMAKVTRSHASAGSITVMGAGRTNAVPNLNEGNLFVGDSNNQAVADDTINVDIANSTVGISGVLSIPSGRAVASEDVYYIVKLTQAEYDALTPDASTMYIITDEDFNSPVINPIKTVASNYTITDTDYTILVSGSSTVNITLPSATINSNYVYNIKNITTNSVVVTPSAGYIDGDISKTINQKFESIATQSDGSNWYII